MTSKFALVAVFLALFCVIYAVFKYGYYRGFEDRSRRLTTFHLQVNNALHSELQQKDYDRIDENLKVMIDAETDDLHLSEIDPLRHFIQESSTVSPQSRVYIKQFDRFTNATPSEAGTK